MKSITYLRKHRKRLSISGIAKEIGMDRSNFYRAVFGDGKLKQDKLTNLDKLIKELKK